MKIDLRKLLLVAVLTIVPLASSCASKHRYGDAAASGYTGGVKQPSLVERRVVRKASQRIEVKDVTVATRAATQLAQKSGGYVESSSKSDDRSSSLELRVPSETLDSVLDELAMLGKEQRRSVNTMDKTTEFIDLEAKIKNTMAYRDQLRVLLSRAKDIKDVSNLQEDLNRVQSELDSLEGLMRLFKNDVAYSSIELTLEKQRTLGPIGYVFKGTFWVIGKLFVL
jgi:hypothetical protein